MSWVRIVVAVARRPSLWAVSVRQARRMAPTGWYRRAPFLPLPPREYLRFRLLTQHGRADRPPVTDDVLNYLAWCKRMDGLR